MRTANPALNETAFDRSLADKGDEVMTLNGTINKSFTLIVLVMAGAGITWFQFFNGSALAMPIAIGGAIGGLIVGLITSFNRKSARITAPIYAILEGLFLGGLSAYLENFLPGIVIQAIALTLGIFLGLLLAYKSGWIKATENFKLGVTAATFGIAFIYGLTWILGFFGMGIPFIHEGGTIGIIFSLVVVVIAALNLVLDFDFIETGAEQGAPKYMEWYAAFGLLVTLVWLYIEILRLLAKIFGRD